MQTDDDEETPITWRTPTAEEGRRALEESLRL
jgi:hypothetical protein